MVPNTNNVQPGGNNSSLSFLDKMFKFSERGSSLKTEVIGGVTTFLTMAYIVFVNPAILSEAGMDKAALITVTILATAIGTLIFAILGNAPSCWRKFIHIFCNSRFTWHSNIGSFYIKSFYC